MVVYLVIALGCENPYFIILALVATIVTFAACEFVYEHKFRVTITKNNEEGLSNEA